MSGDERSRAVETALTNLVSLVANTGFHNTLEMAAARKALRHEGWTDAGHAWLDAGAPLPNSRKEVCDADPS